MDFEINKDPKIKGNIVLELKDFLSKRYKLQRTKTGVYCDGNHVDWIVENSIFIECKTYFPKTTKSLIKSILNSDFI